MTEMMIPYPDWQQTARAAINPYAETTRTWGVGVGYASSTGTNSVDAGGAEAWMMKLTPFDIRRYDGLSITLTKIDAWVVNCSLAKCNAVRFGVWSLSGGVYTLVYSEALTVADADTAESVSKVLSNVLTFTDDAGTMDKDNDFFYGLMFHVTATGTSGVIKMSSSAPADGVTGYVAGAGMPASFTGGEIIATDDRPTIGKLEFTTTEELVYEKTVSLDETVNRYILLPHLLDATGIQHTKYIDVVPGEDRRTKLETYRNVNGAGTVASPSTHFDYRNATSSWFWTVGNSENIIASQANDTFDVMVFRNVATDRGDAMILNTSDGQGDDTPESTSDISTRSHYATKNASRLAATKWTCATDMEMFHWLATEIAGGASTTSTIASVQVGVQPLIILGDSNAVILDNTMADAMPRARMWWLAAINSSRIMADSAGTADDSLAGYLRYEHTTPGLGDICEIEGAIFVWAGYGVNDISLGLGAASTDAEIVDHVGNMLRYASQIVRRAVGHGTPTIIIGLPPWDAAETQEATAIKLFNRGLHGLAQATGSVFVDAYWTTVDKSTINDATPQFVAANTAAGLHYSATGAGLVNTEASVQLVGAVVYDRERT